MLQSRWKSPVVWTSLAGLVALIAKTWFGWTIPGWDEIIAGTITVLCAVGILNNPTDKLGF
jgi:uncharacterized membrane protein